MEQELNPENITDRRSTYGSLDTSTCTLQGSSPPSLSGADRDDARRMSVEAPSPLEGVLSKTERSGTGRLGWAAVVMAVGIFCVVAAASTRYGSRANKNQLASQVVQVESGSLLAAHQLLPAGVDHEEPAVTTTLLGGLIQDNSNDALEYTVTNFYHDRDGKPGALIPWLEGVKLAEPYRDTTLKVATPREGYSYQWEVRSIGDREEVLARASGAEVVVMFTRLDANLVTLREVDDTSGETARELTDSTVMVKYVRREIRTLTDDEREELLDAMVTLWKVRVSGGAGKEIYGEDYQDIWAINRLHFKSSADSSCDYFHVGLGFLTSHSLLTNTFEHSLQIVNPKLTVPYWDFTIETSTFGGKTPDKKEPQKDSPVLTSDWFGSSDPEDYMVKDGRWAYTEVERVEVNNPGGLQPDVYSKLRSPWTINDRPYLSRGLGNMCGVRMENHPWPTCEYHYLLSTDYSDFYSWVWYSGFDPHGGVHAWLGGMLDCATTRETLVNLVGVGTGMFLTSLSYVYRLHMFRYGYFSCNGIADVNVKPHEVLKSGQCGCHGYNLESGDDHVEMLDALGLSTILEGFDEDTKRTVMATLCSTTLVEGDHLQSSSSLDPTFWPLHPTMERLWMFKRLTGTMIDMTWPDSDTTFTTDSGETVTYTLSWWGEDCKGHAGSDVFPFGLEADTSGGGFKVSTGIRGHDTPGGNIFSNREVLEKLDPRLNSLDYIYDTFEWKHCTDDGYDLNDAWNT